MPFDGKNYQTNTTADVLRRARALIDTPEKWGRAGDGIRLGGPRRCIILAIGDADTARDGRAMLLMARTVPGMMHEFNDTHSHAEVLSMFDKAIALAEAES